MMESFGYFSPEGSESAPGFATRPSPAFNPFAAPAAAVTPAAFRKSLRPGLFIAPLLSFQPEADSIGESTRARNGAGAAIGVYPGRAGDRREVGDEHSSPLQQRWRRRSEERRVG